MTADTVAYQVRVKNGGRIGNERIICCNLSSQFTRDLRHFGLEKQEGQTPGSRREMREHFFTLERVFAVPNWPLWPPVLYTGPHLVLCQCAVTNPGGVPHFSHPN